MRKIIIILTALVLSLSLRANDRDSLWNDAVNAYNGSDYEVALRGFTELEREGYSSPELFYNIGNTYYKMDNYTAKSILYYERALRLNPSYSDAENNLELAKLQTLDKIDVVPEFVLISWIKSLRDYLSSDSWAWWAVGMFILTATLLLLFRFAGRMGIRKVSFVCAILSFLLFVSSLLFSISQYRQSQRKDQAIVMVPVSSVKSSPNESGQSLFIIHEGTKVEIIDELGQWNRIELSDGRQGWLLVRDIEII